MTNAIIAKSKETTCLGKCAKHCYIPYLSLTLSLLLLGIIGVASCVVVVIIKENHSNTAASELSDQVHFAYGILPLVLIPSLFIAGPGEPLRPLRPWPHQSFGSQQLGNCQLELKLMLAIRNLLLVIKEILK